MTGGEPGPLRFSIVLASRDRLPWLRRCLKAISQLDYPAFEVIVVADGASLSGIERQHIRTVTFEEANLSRARNLGVHAAGGEVCAFIDDDAVPEPLWLRHLDAALRGTGADAAVGFVRGRNGISFQSGMAWVDAEAETHAAPFEGSAPAIPEPVRGCALKLVGTNMAVRRAVLGELGGFDPLYRFFLEDADLSLRLARAGYRLAVAPLAEVHHGVAPSDRRTRLRVPKDLFDIGRSSAIFLRRHLGRADPELHARIHGRERARLLRHMIAGTCEPRDVGRRLAGLEAGWKEGAAVPLDPPGLTLSDREFMPFPARPGGHRVLAAPLLLRRHRLLAEAEAAAGEGARVSVFSFSLTPVRHHVRYTDSGVWLQTGGLYGQSDRRGPVFKWCRFARRVGQEIRRVANARSIGEND